MQADTKNLLKSSLPPCDSNNLINIPLAFHFKEDYALNPCDRNFDCLFSKIVQQMDVLNEVFNDRTDSNIINDCPTAYQEEGVSAIPENGACFNFYLAQPPTNSGLGANSLPITFREFTGYAQGGSGAGITWNDYLNVFVGFEIGSDGVTDMIPGMPGGINNTKRNGDGVNIRSGVLGGIGGPCADYDTSEEYDLGITLAHEIGHYLGLFHTFSDRDENGCGVEPANVYTASGTNIDISVEDTPTATEAQTDCSVVTSCLSLCGVNQQVGNIMNYAQDNCRDLFTKDQIFAMRTVANDLYGSLNIPAASSVINTDTEWSDATDYINNGFSFNVKYQPIDVVVKSGSTLTIKNLTVYFTNNARIVVEKNAKLIVDNSSLKTFCEQYIWPGIQVWGDPNYSHPTSVTEQGSYTNHGVVFVKNNSRIEYASNAIKTIKVDNWGLPTQELNPNHHNGIVIVDGSYFYNNLCSIILKENNQQNDSYTSSKVTNTEFELDQYLFDVAFPPPDTILPEVQISLKNMNGYKMSNVDFIVRGDYLSDDTTHIPTGIAVHGLETTFTFDDISSITNFNYGIQALFSLADQKTQTKIHNSTFRDNENSITLTGYMDDFSDAVTSKEDIRDIGLHIVDNHIYLKQENITPATYTNNNEWGIRLEACSDYIVSNNTIKGGYAVGTALPCYGIMTYESTPIGVKHNYVQKNKIGGVENAENSKIFAGTYAWGDNQSLQILCNSTLNMIDLDTTVNIIGEDTLVRIVDADTTVNIIESMQTPFVPIQILGNPFNKQLLLQTENNQPFNIIIYNMQGMLVYEGLVRGTLSLKTENWQSGAYILQVVSLSKHQFLPS